MRIYHLVDPSVWDAACAAGEYRPPSLSGDGFIHCSFADQVAQVANARYDDRDRLLVVELESDDLASPVKIETVADQPAGEQFPHVYGAVRTAAQTAAVELRRGADGRWVFQPPLNPADAADPASPDR